MTAQSESKSVETEALCKYCNVYPAHTPGGFCKKCSGVFPFLGEWDRLAVENKELRAATAAMRQVLRLCENIDAEYCEECKQDAYLVGTDGRRLTKEEIETGEEYTFKIDHQPNCFVAKVEKALSISAGRDLLERLERAESRNKQLAGLCGEAAGAISYFVQLRVSVRNNKNPVALMDTLLQAALGKGV